MPFWNALNTPKGKLFISKHYAPSKEFWNAGCLKQEKAVFFHKLTPKWNWAQLDFFGSQLKQQGYKGYVECYCVGESDEMFMNVKKFLANMVYLLIFMNLFPLAKCQIF